VVVPAGVVLCGRDAAENWKTAKRNADEGERFFKVGRTWRRGRIAHADIIKAENTDCGSDRGR